MAISTPTSQVPPSISTTTPHLGSSTTLHHIPTDLPVTSLLQQNPTPNSLLPPTPPSIRPGCPPSSHSPPPPPPPFHLQRAAHLTFVHHNPACMGPVTTVTLAQVPLSPLVLPPYHSRFPSPPLGHTVHQHFRPSTSSIMLTLLLASPFLPSTTQTPPLSSPTPPLLSL